MLLRRVYISLTGVLSIVILLECFQFGRSLADSEETSEADNQSRLKREATPTKSSSVRGSCCVCGVAVYKATFISQWNKTTHPNDYPEKLAHFSTVIGGTHGDAHVVWELGTKASPAVKRFTEWGDTRSLLNKSSRKKYMGIIKIGPVMKTNRPISDRFRADRYNHYLSIISKITPSPDWFVGVDRFDLCNASDCSWRNNITIQLRPIDAGTDSGLKFKATNIQSQPTQAIHQIRPNVPNHPAASFYNREQSSVPPMAKFKIELVHTKGRCSRNTDPNARSNCVLSRWSEWTPCNAQCGRGIKTRGRVIMTPAKNGGKCSKTTRTKGCRGYNCTSAKPKVKKVDCAVSDWSGWSECSRTCGRGKKTRQRDIVVHPRNGGEKCPTLKIKSRCRVKRCPVRHCKVSQWSGWSPCSKSCGGGKRHRSRELIQIPTREGRKCPALKERQFCNVYKCRGWSKLSSISG